VVSKHPGDKAQGSVSVLMGGTRGKGAWHSACGTFRAHYHPSLTGPGDAGRRSSTVQAAQAHIQARRAGSHAPRDRADAERLEGKACGDMELIGQQPRAQ
jgi:hypothetical protein